MSGEIPKTPADEAMQRAVVVAGVTAVEGAVARQRPQAPYVPYDPARRAMQRAMGAVVTGVEAGGV